MSPLVYPDTTMDRIKTVVDGFVANSIRLRSSFLDREKTIREATATISAAPLTPEMASAVARYFSTIEAELGIVALKVESQFESNIALSRTWLPGWLAHKAGLPGARSNGCAISSRAHSETSPGFAAICARQGRECWRPAGGPRRREPTGRELKGSKNVPSPPLGKGVVTFDGLYDD